MIERLKVEDRDDLHTTISGVPVREVYTREDADSMANQHTIGMPGEFPFTRGIHANMYRGRHWTMRQFAGFGTPEQTNERFRLLLEKGQTGLSTAFDLPTLMGFDSDDPKSDGEVGRLGVAMDTVDDMLGLFDGIDLEQISVSMTINAPAAVLMAFYVAAAQERGFDLGKLRGTIQNDILKEFHAQNEFVYPPEPSVSLVIDLVEFCVKQIPQWNTISISGYHIREAGSTAVQELAFTLADGRHYVEQALRRDLEIDQFAPRFSFFFNAHNDMFEEIAKYRAAREIWAKLMRDTYSAKNPKSWMMRFHAQTAGCSLQDKQPEVNLMRVAYQAMAAVLGGCQSLHTNCMDETLALPTEHAVTLALRTQQVLAHETGVVNTVDPLGGSYFIETTTAEMQQGANDYFDLIEQRGGMMEAIDSGFFRREIADSAYQFQCSVDAGGQKIVGVTDFVQEDANPIDLLTIDHDVQDRQIASLNKIKNDRSADEVQRTLDGLRSAAAASQNMMEPLIEAAHARATVGEIMKAMADVYGTQAMKQLQLDLQFMDSTQTASSTADAASDQSDGKRILLAKVGLDGHDRGIKVVARGLRDSGFHVIYGGIWQSAEAVAQAALDEDADWLGLSLLSGAHMTLVPRVLEAVRATGNQRTRCMLGGIIPEEDFAELNKIGVVCMFGPGSTMASISEFLQQPNPTRPCDDVGELVQAAKRNDRVALARLLTLCGEGRVDENIFSDVDSKPFRTIAFTGSAGVGKSSLIAELIPELTKQAKKTAVLACDPQSPITGGALLGDRIRMGGQNFDPETALIRSIPVPSGQQGVSQHLGSMTKVLQSSGFDLAIVESVGVGQGDVAAGDVADKVIVLLQPESGDDVQWEKAGLLEIADMIVIQKSDLPGADRLEAELKQHFNLPGFRSVPIMRVSAAKKEGIAELCERMLK